MKLITEASVETELSSRYLIQICRHFDQKAQSHPEFAAQVEWSPDHGVVTFGWGRCVLRAEPGVLTMRAESPDEENLHRVERLVTDHLLRFGRRDRLAATWAPAQGGDG